MQVHPTVLRARPALALRAILLALLSTLAQPAFWLSGQAAHAAPTDCHFILGFQALQQRIAATVGACVENQSFAPNGDAIQHTARGLLVWRKSDNWTAFTDGSRTWIDGPLGLQERANMDRFSWELPPSSDISLADARAASMQYRGYTADEVALLKQILHEAALNAPVDIGVLATYNLTFQQSFARQYPSVSLPDLVSRLRPFGDALSTVAFFQADPSGCDAATCWQIQASNGQAAFSVIFPVSPTNQSVVTPFQLAQSGDAALSWGAPALAFKEVMATNVGSALVQMHVPREQITCIGEQVSYYLTSRFAMNAQAPTISIPLDNGAPSPSGAAAPFLYSQALSPSHC